MVTPLGPERIKRSHVQELEIRNGMPVMLEPDGLGMKIRTYFIGMEKRCYLIFALSHLYGQDKAAYDYFYKGNPAKVFYTNEGVVNGFVSEILGYTASPYRHIYLKYPTVAESCNLREHKRTDCHLPATFDLNGKSYTGLITNVSEGGCALCVRKDGDDSLKGLGKGTGMGLKFYINKSEQETLCSCKVMNVVEARGKRLFGLKFLGMPEEAEKRLAEFISFVVEHRM